VLAYPVIVMLAPIGAWSFSRWGLEAEQLRHQNLYFNVLCYGSIIPMLRISLGNFFGGIGKTHIVLCASLVTMVSNIGTNYILIFGKWGFPALGIQGAAYGTLLAGVFGVMTLLIFLIQPQYALAYAPLEACRISKKVFFRLLRFGSPAGLELFLNVLAFGFIVSIFQSHSLVTATAITIVFNYDMLAFIPLIGLEISVTSLVGRYVGAKQLDTAHASVVSAFKLGMIFCLMVGFAFAIFPEVLIRVFEPTHLDSNFQEALPLATTMLRVASIYVLVEALMLVYSGALRGAGDTFWSMIISVVSHWTLVLVLYVGLNVLSWSPQQAWGLLTVIFMFLSSAFYFRYRTGKWRTIQLQ
jgi:MATE family multidrug resistance protein